MSVRRTKGTSKNRTDCRIWAPDAACLATQARGVLALIAKVGAFLVDLRRKKIRLSKAAEKMFGEFRASQSFEKRERLNECSVPLRALERRAAERVLASSSQFFFVHFFCTQCIYLGRETGQQSWYVPIGCTRYVPKFARGRRLAWPPSGVLLVSRTPFIDCV